MKKSFALFLSSTDHNINKSNINSLRSASGRMQLRPAAKACLKYRLEVESTLPSYINSDLISIDNKSGICFIGKISSKKSEEKTQLFIATLAKLANLKAQNIPICYIYSDHFEGKEQLTQDFHKTLLLLGDCTVFPSQKLAELASPFTRKNNQHFIIYDQCQIQASQFPGKIEGEARLIWFGSDSNINYLVRCLDQIHPMENQFYELTILASKYALSFYQKFFEKVSARPGWKIRPIEWNTNQQPSQLQTELERAQVSLIPSDPSDPKKAGVSHNRLTDSIQGGCITIASPMESYKELSRLAILGKNFRDLIPIAISQSERLSKKYEKLRTSHMEEFGESRNSAKWEKVVAHLLNHQNIT